MADHGLTLRILSVFLVMVTVLLIVQHYQKKRSSMAEGFATDNAFGPVYSSDVYGAPPASPVAAGAAADAMRPYDQGVPFYGEKMVAVQQSQSQHMPSPAGLASAAAAGGLGTAGSDPVSNAAFRAVDYQVRSPPTNANLGCFPKDRLTAQDLLPKDAANSTWSKVMPAGQGDVSNQNFLTSGFQLGLSSSVVRNANYGLRSEPPNPQVVVSPWQNSTIDPDLLRRPLELQEAPGC